MFQEIKKIKITSNWLILAKYVGLNSYHDQGYSEYLVHFGVSKIHFVNSEKAFKETGISQGYKHNILLIFAKLQNGVWSYPLHCSPAHSACSYTFQHTSHAHFCLRLYPSHSIWYILPTVIPSCTCYPTSYLSHSSSEHTSCCHTPPQSFKHILPAVIPSMILLYRPSL